MACDKSADHFLSGVGIRCFMCRILTFYDHRKIGGTELHSHIYL